MTTTNEPIQRKHKGAAHVVQRFDSLGEWADFLDTPRTEGATAESLSNPTNWNGGEDWDTVRRRVTEGWAEHRDLANEVASQITADAYKATEAMRPAFQIDFSGASVDMGRFLSGDPQNMVDFRLSADSAQERVVTLLIGSAYACSVDAEAIVKRGAAVVALIDILAATGRSVEVWCEFHSMQQRGPKTHFSTLVRVKAPDAPMDLDQLLFVMAHPGAQRKANFATWERLPADLNRRVGAGNGGYGYGMNTDPADMPACGALVDATVELRRPNNRMAEVTRPVEWITSILDKIAHEETVAH